MNRLTKFSIASLAFGLLAGCATVGPSEELIEARRAFRAAQNSKAAELAPDEVHGAARALRRAELAHQDDAQSATEKHYAYLAERRAERAIAAGEARDAKRARAAANKQYLELQAQMRREAEEELARREGLLESERERTRMQREREELEAARREMELEAQQREQELATARREAQIAEERAQAALRSLEEVAKVQEEARRTIITLSGSVMFASGQSSLLPIARNRLDDVAEALKVQRTDRDIMVIGHTDSVGTEAFNQTLSLMRAQSVRDYLIQQGIPAERITATGRGESQPIAPNDTPEGRANNRRVEIVLQPRPVG